ncbi:SDR family oxidoreductase [Aureibacter tunicatorum]|uniref:NAD(P)-dependent dehydrogenase (Short-subunit alcohol dehydrogenase family) n=1 Tax=Aureibacter tunicatorum TaxID=866807 RepID=A0AAE3XP26_9BACT|nr:SDR family oxidoreductase [Aureibacter tunicatorum]MDR6240497.1 NAD(P)-dependent dehydrogenase (short-subunit alcohol dehydrogenase family) [Aureibacter tunicatorum]BDD06640.1 short-chain dehydrogenase [Aureibacter tunicatorum]
MKNKSYLNKDLTGKTIVFTGGTDGMGKAAAQKLAGMGATIMLLGRSKEKTMKVVAELNSIAEKESVMYIPCDLASQKSIRKAAELILEHCPKIDVLINCAGMNAGERVITEDGYEMSWAVNHLAPFLLNNLLLDRMKASAPARIVNLSSATEKYGHIQLDDIPLKNKWSTFRSYTQAKLAMNMCTRKMAKELEGSGVTVNALNPGFIKTNLLRSLKGWELIIGVPYMFFFASKPEVGGDRILRLALSDEYEGVSGKYVYEDAVRDPNPEALDNELVDKVWKMSLEHIGF